jgi:hypothetical protein
MSVIIISLVYITWYCNASRVPHSIELSPVRLTRGWLRRDSSAESCVVARTSGGRLLTTNDALPQPRQQDHLVHVRQLLDQSVARGRQAPRAVRSVANLACCRIVPVGPKKMRSDLYPVLTMGRRFKGSTRAPSLTIAARPSVLEVVHAVTPWHRVVHGPHEPTVCVLVDGGASWHRTGIPNSGIVLAWLNRVLSSAIEQPPLHLGCRLPVERLLVTRDTAPRQVRMGPSS